MQATTLAIGLLLAGCGQGCGQTGTVYIFHGPLGSASVPAATVNSDRYNLSVVAAGDINGDGRPDFIVASDEATDLYFGVHDDADATTSEDTGLVTLGDVNGDGRADVLLNERFYPGSARPFEQPGIALPGALTATAADVDGDGIADLVVVGRDQSLCSVSVYHGGASFDVTAAPETAFVLQSDGTPDLSLTSAGDLDGDGRDDLVLEGPCVGTEKIVVYLGGVPLSSAPSRVLAEGNFPVLARDFDGDGYGDLAVSDVSDPTSPQVLVYFGPALDTPRLRVPGTIADAGDVDGDGHPDLIVIQSTGDVGVDLGGPAMDDTLDIDLAAADGQPFTSAAYLGDLDGDGTPDLAVAYSGWRAE